jgi:hypothetical protein
MRWPASAGQTRPGLQGLPPLHQLIVVARHLPAAIDAAAGTAAPKCHQLQVLRLRLEIVQRRDGTNRVAEGGVFSDVGDKLAVDIDRAPVLERVDMLGPGPATCHRPLPPTSLAKSSAKELYINGFADPGWLGGFGADEAAHGSH